MILILLIRCHPRIEYNTSLLPTKRDQLGIDIKTTGYVSQQNEKKKRIKHRGSEKEDSFYLKQRHEMKDLQVKDRSTTPEKPQLKIIKTILFLHTTEIHITSTRV